MEFLYCVLAESQAHTSGVVIGLAPIHGHAVSPAVTAIEGEAALRCLLDAKIGGVCQSSRVRNSRHQQRVRKIVTAIDGQFSDVLAVDGICLMSPFRVHYGRLGTHFHHLFPRRHLHAEVHDHRSPHIDHHILVNFVLETGLLDAYIVVARRQTLNSVFAASVTISESAKPSCGIDRNNRRLGHNGTGGIGDRPLDVPGDTNALGADNAGQHEQEQEGPDEAGQPHKSSLRAYARI